METRDFVAQLAAAGRFACAHGCQKTLEGPAPQFSPRREVEGRRITWRRAGERASYLGM
jgi:hypothetical protein